MANLLLITVLITVSTTILASPPSPRVLLASTGPSDDPIAVTPPNLPGGTVAVDAPPGPFFKDFQPPFPTDAWWSGYTVSNQDADAAGPFPFQSATTSLGLAFGISDIRRFDGTSIHVDTQKDWLAGFEGLPDDINHRKALSWDTQTVCLQYFTDDGSSTMDSCLVPGSPYITLTFKNAIPVLTSLKGDIVSLDWPTPNRKGKVVTAGGTYLIYAIDFDIQLTQVDQKLVSPSPWTGTLRLAKLKEASQESILDAHSGTYPTGLVMSYTVANDVSTQTWTWNVVGNPGDLLILSWPHHRKALQGPNYVEIDYLTIKGHMRGVSGNTWILHHDLPTISWFPANNPHPSCLAELGKTLESEVSALSVLIPGDFYFWGGSFGRAAQLATIAEHIGRNDLIDPVINILKQSIAYWFDPAHKPAAAFESGWGGFVNGDGWNNTWVDFGNAYYNDHHFHYGYLLHGAAVIGKYDPGWLNENLDFLTHVARDVGNPSPNDPHYTVTRHMDWFAGHSWASGIANGAGGRDQESSGEAINGYYGLLLFAHAINNQALIDYARMLTAIEIAGAQAYWHLYTTNDDPDTPYPEQEFRDLVTVGNVMDSQVGAWLFWGGQRIQITAIQILPLTPIGQITFDQKWMQEVVPYCKAELDDYSLEDAFKSVIYAAHAKVNPQEAYGYSEGLFDWGTGNSATNQLYFVATQPSATDICTAATQSPEGTFHIQDVASGKFITLGPGNSNLGATASVSVLATKFNLNFKPGGGTIQAQSNGKFVTAAPDGQQVLTASRDSPASYEIFRWTSFGDDIYELTAMVNRAQVSTGGDGQLLNNVNGTVGVASRYRLIEANGETVPVPTGGVLKNLDTGKYVVATAGDPILRATANSAAEATRWTFEQIEDSPVDAPYHALRSEETQMVVTASPDGTTPLEATRAEPSAWEYFQLVGYQGNFIVLHVVSGMAAAVQPDGTLIDNNNSIDNTAQWAIE